MMFSLSLTITHPALKEPIEHVDMFVTKSRAAMIKQLNMSAKQACELKNQGSTQWQDEHGATHRLELKEET